MEKIRVLIVDDEPIAREGLRTLLSAERNVEIIGECRNGREAVQAIRVQAPDLVFLDVQMPKMNGLEVIEQIGVVQMPAVVFVTAYDQYALQAFEINAMDYLLKPFDEERFQKTLQRAGKHFQQQNAQNLQQRLAAVLDHFGNDQPKRPKRFVVKSAGRIFFVNVDEIDWIAAAGNYVQLHVGPQSHLLRQTMDAIEAMLDAEKFLRIRRSAIVHVERIKELKPLSKGEYQIILRDGTQLASSRRYRAKLDVILNAT
ncbi:MAG: LytR/AlgR family response regulator transcription factor, partial [bacterium]